MPRTTGLRGRRTCLRLVSGWPAASGLAYLVEQWIPRAVGLRGAVDALIVIMDALAAAGSSAAQELRQEEE